MLVVMDAFATAHLQVCCGNTCGGGMDEDGNGEPPQCCGQPLDSDDLREARAAAEELIEALRQSDEWIKRAVINGSSQPSTATLFRNKAALAKAKGEAP